MSRRELAPQTLTVALPAMLGEERLALIAEDLAEIEEPPIELIVHELPPEGPDGGKRWILFIDPYGIARVATLYLGRGSGFDDKLKHWLRVFREHGRPERALPEYGREELEDELEGEG